MFIPAKNIALAEHIQAIEDAAVRLNRVTKQVAEAMASWSMDRIVKHGTKHRRYGVDYSVDADLPVKSFHPLQMADWEASGYGTISVLRTARIKIGGHDGGDARHGD